MDVLGLLAIGAAFLLFLSLLTGSGSANDGAASGPVVFIGTPPASPTQAGDSSIGFVLGMILLMFLIWMLQAA